MKNVLSKHKKTLRLAFIYCFMIAAIVAAVVIATFFMFGYRLNLSTGKVEQYALMQFKSTPDGASVWVDSDAVLLKTPNKTNASSGTHKVAIWKDGYQTWSKTVDIEAGDLIWLSNALLVPTNLKTQTVSKYDSLDNSLASPDNKSILLQEKSSEAVFRLVDISGSVAKTTSLTIPADSYTQPSDATVANEFQMVRWDDANRYVLIKHTYGTSVEWLVLDTENASNTKNITTTFAVGVDDIRFDGTSGDKFYALTSSTIRLLNLNDGTISKVLVNNVTSFDFCQDTNIITYIGTSDDKTYQIVGIYHSGDSGPVVLRRDEDMTTRYKISTETYGGKDYIVLTTNKKVAVYSGDYPTPTGGDLSTMDIETTFDTMQDADQVSFSPSGEYLVIRYGNSMTTYDIEYNQTSISSVDSSVTNFTINWLNNYNIWFVKDGKLRIREFDGTNAHNISSAISNQSAVLTSDNTYIYSINKIDDKFVLQRTKMTTN